MEKKYSVKLSSLAGEFSLDPIYLPPDYDSITIVTPDVNRPAVQLSGFYEYFDTERLQIMGTVETMYMKRLSEEEQREKFDVFFSKKVSAVIVCHGMEVLPACAAAAAKYETPLFRTEQDTSEFLSALIASLKISLAPRITRHGVLVEVYGEGILLLGESGVGKSETAIELVKRGHRLIADDAVEIKKTSAVTLVGSAPELIRHYIELRGIGVIDVRRLFGMGAVKIAEKINLVINIEQWKDGAMYDRLGVENQYTTILGVKVPSLTVPVKPGRNLAVIIEVAAMNDRQRQMGYNAALEFTKQINRHFDESYGGMN